MLSVTDRFTRLADLAERDDHRDRRRRAVERAAAGAHFGATNSYDELNAMALCNVRYNGQRMA